MVPTNRSSLLDWLRADDSCATNVAVSGSFNQPKQVHEGQPQRLTKTLDVDEADVARAPLGVADIGSVKPRFLGQILLGQAQFFAPSSDGVPKTLPDVSRSSPFFHGGTIAGAYYK